LWVYRRCGCVAGARNSSLRAFGVDVLGFGSGVWGLGFGVEGLGFRV